MFEDFFAAGKGIIARYRSPFIKLSQCSCVVFLLSGFTFFDISNKLINHDKCFLGARSIPVRIQNGNVIPVQMPSAIVAEIVKLNADSVRFKMLGEDGSPPIVINVQKQGKKILGTVFYDGAVRTLIVCD
jgi:hypothetical protein